jgi:hypothetical protein
MSYTFPYVKNVQERLLEMSGFVVVYSGCGEIGHQT